MVQLSEFIATLIGATLAGGIGLFTAHQIQKKSVEASRKSVATAVYKEMENLLNVMEELLEDTKDDVSQQALVNLVGGFGRYTRVFDANLDKIGLLGAQRVGELRWSHFVGQFGSAVKVYSCC